MTQQTMPESSGVAPYLNLEGAAKAADFYIQAFGAEELYRMPPDAETGRTMHIHLRINGGSVMLSDFYPEQGHAIVKPAGFLVHLQIKQDIEGAWKRAVDAGATITMPLADMFWGARYGQLKDPFGVAWSLGQTL